MRKLLPQNFKKQSGAAPVPILVAVIALVGFLLISGTAGFKNKLFSGLFPKPSSQAATATDCTLYASPTGGGTGSSPTSPLTFQQAHDRTQPGSVVCLLSGTYNIPSTFYLGNSGTPSAWIVYKSYDGGARLVYTSTVVDDVLQITTGTRYIEINGLIVDGNNVAGTNIKCQNTNYVRIINNTILNSGGTGAGGMMCDYLTIDRNKIYHTGFGTGWGSGAGNRPYWSDTYQGFHNFITNNIISGTVDNSSYHSDGNGIIIDMGSRTPQDVSPTLIANNVVYQNGGRCIHSYGGSNVWVVNNTCYKNGLDTRVGDGDYIFPGAPNSRFVNNIAYGGPYNYWNYAIDSNTTNTVFYNNSWYSGAGANISNAQTVVNMRQLNPLFVNPPSSNDWSAAISPDQLGNSLQLQSSSTAINTGIDPRTIPQVTADLRVGLDKYISNDINGNPRPQGGGWDLGAYEYGSATASPTPTPTPPFSASPTPTPTPAGSLSFEAESMILTSPLTITTGTPTYISQNIETGTQGGQATYTVNIPFAGSYTVKGVVNAYDGLSDSFYVNFDNQPIDPDMIWDIVHTTGFAERVVSWRGGATYTSANPKVFNLSAGNHTLIIRGREANVKLDKISIVSTISPTPTPTSTPTTTPTPTPTPTPPVSASPTPTPTPISGPSTVVEAENMSLIPNSNALQVLTDVLASGGKYMKFWSNATSNISFNNQSSTSQVILRASGDQCSGAPNVIVRIDGITVYSAGISSSYWAGYTFTKSVSSGLHNLSVEFNNDYVSKIGNSGKIRCDRNLKVDKVTFN